MPDQRGASGYLWLPFLRFPLERSVYCAVEIIGALVLAGLVQLVAWIYLEPELVPAAIVVTIFAAFSFFVTVKTKNEFWSAALTVLSAVSAILAVALNHEFYVRHFEVMHPYIGIKLLMLVVAWIAPPQRWVPYTIFASVIIMVLTQYFDWPAEFQRKVGNQEPSVTVIFAICAAVLYENRMRVFSLIRFNAVREERHAIIRRLAHLLLGAKHLSSTPLQTIQNSVQLMSKKHPDLAGDLAILDRSIHALSRIHILLLFGEEKVDWETFHLPANIQDFETEVGIFLKDFDIRTLTEK